MKKYIEFKNVKKVFNVGNRDITALDDLSIDFYKTEFISIVGPSGSGKSTFLRCLAGLEELTSGIITIDNRSVSSKNNHEFNFEWLPQKVAFTFFDDHNINYNLSIGQKLKNYPNDSFKDKLKQISTLLRINTFFDRFPKELSGGELQRVALARAMMNESVIYLFDEPFTSLDEISKNEIRNDFRIILEKINGTTFYVTHDLSEALSLSSKCLVMNNGKIEQYDTPKNIFFNPVNVFVAKYFSKYWNQFNLSLRSDEIKINIQNNYWTDNYLADSNKNSISLIGFRGEDVKTNIEESKSQDYFYLGEWEIKEIHFLGCKTLLICQFNTNQISIYIDTENFNERIKVFIPKHLVFVYQI